MFREDGTTGETAPTSFPVVSQKALEIPRVTGQTDSSHSGNSRPTEMVGMQGKSAQRLSVTPVRAQPVDFHRRLRKGLGGSSRSKEFMWDMVRSRTTFAHKCFGVKSRVSSIKRLWGVSFSKRGTHLFRQCDNRELYQQTRRHQISTDGGTCLENNGMVHCKGNSNKSSSCTGISKCHCRCAVTEGQNHPFGMVTENGSFPKNLSSLVHSSDRHVCNFKKFQNSKIHLPNTRPTCMEGRCVEHSLGQPRGLCLLPRGDNSSGDPQNVDISMSDDCHCSRMAGDGLVLGSSGSLNRATPAPSTVVQPAETTAQQYVSQELGVSESPRLAVGLQEASTSGFSASVEERVKAPQRESSRAVYTSRWSLFRSWCKENKVDLAEPPISKIADFLLFLFEDKGLKPSTIAGYRTAIADGLGASGEKVSKSRELNRLLASFFRDRPRLGRHIPSWDLSLVLLTLTKAPFEPLRDADLKMLTLKTVFLLALASGKRRGEIHAWLHSSVFFKRNNSKVTLAPSPAFIAKNQLASEGSSVVKQVVIPALAPLLDSGLKEDRTLCPVRALRIYLDRTQKIRTGKSLLFVSFKPGFNKDISRSTISHWIKQTVQICYRSADSETLQLSKVKAHDVRALSSSLAFKGGVPLDDILHSCFWKSHGTFTNFYLKDVCWENDNVFKLGPIVAAQHVVSSM